MLVSEQKPLEEILAYLEGEQNVFLVGCHGCAEASGTGGPKHVREMKGRLEEAGKTIAGWTVLGFLCQRALVKTGLKPFESQIMAADEEISTATISGTAKRPRASGIKGMPS